MIVEKAQQHTMKTMAAYDAYDPSSDEDFIPVLKLASFICNCKCSFISFIEHDWQNVRFTNGFEPLQLPLEKSLCKLVYHNDDFFEIPAINEDEEAKALIKEAEINFNYYAGIPLIDFEGNKIGTVCVSDTHSKRLDKNQIDAFKALVSQVTTTLELRKSNLEEIRNTKRNEEFSELFNSSPDLICILSAELKIVSINKTVFDVTGYSVKEVIGMNISEFIVPEDRKTLIRTATRNLKRKIKRFDVETQIQTKDKVIKSISWNACSKNKSWFVTGRDVTYNNKVLQHLKQLSTVASQINNGVVISNANNNVVWINNAFTDIAGYTLEDLEYQKLGDVIAGANSNIDIIEKARNKTNNKKSFSVELLAYRKDGKPIWLAIHNTIILDKGGEVESLIEIVIDITERKQAEERFELLSLVASKTENGVCISDKTGRVNWINNALVKILGYELKDLEGKRLGDLVKGMDTDVKRLGESRAIATKSVPYDLELKVYKKDGTPVWLSISNTPILDENGHTDKQIEIINDISERKKAEIQLLKSKEQALQLSKAKEMFLSIMSHEIRTPLNAVIGLSNLLIQEQKLDAQVQSLNLLKFSADNLLNLINDILDFSKIEMGKMNLEKKGVNIRELVKDIVDSLVFKKQEKGINIKYKVAANVPEKVRADKTRLYQILINLINNAVKFTEKGFVEIEVSLVSMNENHSVLHFEVTDTGIGISEDKFGYIFESFTQAASNTTRKYGGSGLGLPITKKLIELYNGEIKLNSEVGRGTTFYFDLTFDNYKVMEKEIVENEHEKLSLNVKVLVVDDNEINRILAKKILNKFQVEVVTVDSGMEAIRQLESKKFDIVLMDIYMPEMTGYETVGKIRAFDDPYFKELPIIALTASIMHEDIETIYKYGMNDYQIKPFKAEELISKIGKHAKKFQKEKAKLN